MLSAIVTAAGESKRFGNKKQFLKLSGDFVFVHSINKMIKSGADEIILVVSKEDASSVEAVLKDKNINAKIVIGGNTRQLSVAKGFKSCTPDDGLVMIHDAARPFVDLEDIQRVIKSAKKYGAAILGRPVRDTVKKVDKDIVMQTIDRERLFLAQTPQVFKKRLYAKTSFINETITDDSALFEAYGFLVHMVKTLNLNLKITYKEDLKLAELLAMGGYL